MKIMTLLLSLWGICPAVFAKEALPACVAIVRWYAPKFYVKSRMKKSLPEYQGARGLHYKYFTFGENGTFGGIYLWKDRAAADAWFTPQWIVERSKKYGRDITVPRYDVLAIGNVGESAPVLEGKFSATLAKYESGPAESRNVVLARFKREASARNSAMGLVRSYLVETAANSYAVISLWDESASPDAGGERFSVPLAIANRKE